MIPSGQYGLKTHVLGYLRRPWLLSPAAYLLLTRQPYKPPDTDTTETAAESAAVGSDQGRASVQAEKEEGAHEGPSNTSLVGSGGATLSTPGGTPIPMPSFASSDHHHRHEAASHTHSNHHEHGGPSNTSLVGSGGATLSTPGGTPIPLYSQSTADHHLRKGEEGGSGAHGLGESAAQKGRRRQRDREIELDQNGDPVTRSPSDDGGEEATDQKIGGDKWSKQSVRLDEPTLDLAIEQYRQGLLLELEKRRKMVPLNKEEKAWIDQEKAMIKEHLRHLPKAS